MSIIEITDISLIDPQLLSCWISKLTGKETSLTSAAIQSIISDPSSHLFVLSEDDVPKGMVTVSLFNILSYGLNAWINDVYVDDGCRGKGYGKKLVLFAQEYALSQGARVISLTSSPSRIEANALYSGTGFNKRTTNVYQIKKHDA